MESGGIGLNFLEKSASGLIFFNRDRAGSRLRNIRKCRPLQWRNSARARKRLDPIERVRIWRGDASEWLFCDSTGWTVAMCRGALCQGIARKTERADRIQPIGGPDRHFGSELGHHAQRQSLPCRELTNWDLIRIRKEAKNDVFHVLDFVQDYLR